MHTSPRGQAAIKQFEAYRMYAYPDPASPLARATVGKPWGMMPARNILRGLPLSAQTLSGRPWTCGYGATHGVTADTVMTREHADASFAASLAPYEAAVSSACSLPPTQPQFDAMVSLCYNIGPANFARSTVARAHNRGDTQAAARAFGLWNKARGQVLPGLTRRRALEAAMYLEPDPMAAPGPAAAEPMPLHGEAPMPQEIDPERPMHASQINRAGVVAGGTAAVATVAETARTVADVKYSATALGDWLVPMLLLAVVALCAYIVWERIKQRREGWA